MLQDIPHLNTNIVIQVTARDLAITFIVECSSGTRVYRVTGQCFMFPQSPTVNKTVDIQPNICFMLWVLHLGPPGHKTFTHLSFSI